MLGPYSGVFTYMHIRYSGVFARMYMLYVYGCICVYHTDYTRIMYCQQTSVGTVVDLYCSETKLCYPVLNGSPRAVHVRQTRV